MGILSLVKYIIFPQRAYTPIETFCAPIWKLPNELMLLIFLKLCHDSLLSETNLAMGQPTPLPLLLSAVCSTWHCIMLDNPTLWSIIHVAFTETSKKPNGRAIHIFLERSKSAPLTIFLQLPSSLSSKMTIQHPAFQALIHEAPRWRLLCLIGDFSILRNDHPIRMVESLPELEVLSLQNKEAPDTLSNFQVVPMPKLHHAVVVTSRSAIDLQSNFPWTQLTMLRLRGFHNVPALVQLCPKLTQLDLILDSELGKALPIYPAVIRHNHVKFLSLWLTNDPDMPKVLEKVLDVLDFPSLDTLVVKCLEMVSLGCSAALSIVNKFIQRSSFTLLVFALHDICIFHDFHSFIVILTILHHIPSITRLVIFDPSRSSKAQDVVDLLRHPTSMGLLPNLQTVEFWTYRKDCDDLQMDLIKFMPLVLFEKVQVSTTSFILIHSHSISVVDPGSSSCIVSSVTRINLLIVSVLSALRDYFTSANFPGFFAFSTVQAPALCLPWDYVLETFCISFRKEKPRDIDHAIVKGT
ncbi:hypothetical protein BDP27DRAFT_1434329 [Rhodocollybia butyracea]|uniref:F-box domain-containing protein n=1 Tax=Rhodocollybia butyracea TaxID=206335 RepID=A0A9P5P3N5_9AGAR|nr:hypothetical protein BDP27DRAFT_1434329 [Rhodocollybia butyracea]